MYFTMATDDLEEESVGHVKHNKIWNYSLLYTLALFLPSRCERRHSTNVLLICNNWMTQSDSAITPYQPLFHTVPFPLFTNFVCFIFFLHLNFQLFT